MTYIPPAWILIIGAFLIPFFQGKGRNWYMIIVPAITLVFIFFLEEGLYWQVQFFGFDLTLLRVDKLSKLFGYIFTLYALTTSIYSYYLRDGRQHMSALFYIGSALGVVFAGDLVSLYFYWEIMAVASVMLILARQKTKAYNAGFRYILVHIVGGLSLLAGIVLYIGQTGQVSFEAISVHNLATYLILIGILVNA